LSYRVEETTTGVKLELTGVGRILSAFEAGLRVALVTAVLVVALSFVDLVSRDLARGPEYLRFFVLYTAVIAGIAGVVAALMRGLGRAQWELDVPHQTASWRMVTALGNHADGDLALEDIHGVLLERSWSGATRLEIVLGNGDRELIASSRWQRPQLERVAERLREALARA